jgi:hypothetical protein
MAAKAAGAVAAAEGDAQRALLALRRALRLWQELEAPYERLCRTFGQAQSHLAHSIVARSPCSTCLRDVM